MEERTLLSGFVVSNTHDSGPGSLRQAILDANDQAGHNDITFDPTAFATPQTITLTSGQLELSDTSGTETITGPAAGVTVSAGGSSRVFQLDSSVPASISGMTITGGKLYYGGAGLYNDGGTITLTGCTINGNYASYGDGAGVYNQSGTVNLIDCTISGNSDATGGFGQGGRGGGVATVNGGTTTLTNCTVSGNSDLLGDGYGGNDGGGVYNDSTSTTTLANTVVVGNAGGNNPDVKGGFTSQGNNLIGNISTSTGWIGSDLTGTSAAPLDPLLAPLGDYGGPTQTMALLPGSPAFGAGNNALIPAGVTTDGRGLPRIVSGKVDIGAFESSGFTIALTSGSGQTSSGTFPAPLVVTVTANNPVEPVAGGQVTFTAPSSGASAVLTGNPAIFSASGTANVTATSNAVAGSYTVSATASGTPGAASFSLTNVALVSIAVSPGNPELAEEVTGQFTATGTFADHSTQDITDLVNWASATPTVATISGTGLATAVVPGTSAITASVAGVTSPADTLTVIALSYVVNTTADDFSFSNGTTSLREAIAGASAHPGQTITFDPTVFASAKTITLSLGQLELSNTSGTETITSPASGVTVSASGASRVFQVDKGVSASISGLTIAGGNAGNFAGGGLLTYGTTSLTNCTIVGNSAYSGGGVYNHSGTLNLIDCTVSGNSTNPGPNGQSSGGGVATGGSGRAKNGTTTLTDCTVSNNSAQDGGGVYNSIQTRYGDKTTLSNTIVAGNTARIFPDVSGSSTAGLTSQGGNLIGIIDGSTGWIGSDLTGTSAAPLYALLAPLGNYGGPTQTIALLPGSPALGAGNNARIPAGVTTDGRGFNRIVSGTVDIGAFESSGFTIAVTSGSGQTSSGAFPAPLVATVSAKNSNEPVAGGLVTFTPPASGASAVVTGSPAIVSASGTASVTAASNAVAGSYTVSATASGAAVAASFRLTNVALVSIAVSPGNPELPVGVPGQFTAAGTFADGSTHDITGFVTWASAKPSVATISSTGLATALAPGTSAIIASLAGVTGPADTLTVIPSAVVNTTADTFGFSNGTISLRDAIAGANTVSGQTITFDPTVFASAADDHFVARPARAERHRRDRVDHGPGRRRDDQRRREQPGVSG